MGLSQEHRPRSFCWNENNPTSHFHTQHVFADRSTLENLMALGNTLSDNPLWPFEALAKINSSQKEIIEDIKLRLSLLEAVSQRIDEQIPTNYSEVLERIVETTQGRKTDQRRLLDDTKLILDSIQGLAQRIVGIEKATGADLNRS